MVIVGLYILLGTAKYDCDCCLCILSICITLLLSPFPRIDFFYDDGDGDDDVYIASWSHSFLYFDGIRTGLLRTWHFIF